MTRNTKALLVAASIIASGALASHASDAEAAGGRCVVQSVVTSPDQVTFTVGPEDCDRPISIATFSAYDLRANDGKVQPYAGQVAVDHVTGRDIGPGTYTWTTDSEGACGAQWDFYNSPPQDSAPHTTWFPGQLGRGVSWFHIEEDGCDVPRSTPTEQPEPEPTPRAPAPTPVPTLPPAAPEPTPRVKLIPPPPVATPWVPAIATPTTSPAPVPTAPPATATPEAPTPARTGHGPTAYVPPVGEERDGARRFALGLGGVSVALLAVSGWVARRRGT